MIRVLSDGPPLDLWSLAASKRSDNYWTFCLGRKKWKTFFYYYYYYWVVFSWMLPVRDEEGRITGSLKREKPLFSIFSLFKRREFVLRVEQLCSSCKTAEFSDWQSASVFAKIGAVFGMVLLNGSMGIASHPRSWQVVRLPVFERHSCSHSRLLFFSETTLSNQRCRSGFGLLAQRAKAAPRESSCLRASQTGGSARKGSKRAGGFPLLVAAHRCWIVSCFLSGTWLQG